MSVSTPRVVAKEDYTVGWVCAIPVEMAAARGMLDETHARLPEQDPADHNAYTLGQIQSHNVVIACLPSGMTGTTSAATVAKDMLRTFKSIRFGLMVGIGGGAPSSEHDIRLGDIVVSRPSGTSGGVIQYDRGKALQGEFLRTGSLNAPPKVLLAALANLQADHIVGETRIPEFLSNLANKNARTRKTFNYPDGSDDCLFMADYQHEAETASTCYQCDRSRLVQRAVRDDQDPQVHYGNIASGNQVIKDGMVRKRLQQEHDVLCFEMEAAGLMTGFPCIVIRGISDYADSHKNDAWQGYAAATAAAFAKELLLVISPAQVEKEKSVPQLVSDPELHERISKVDESIKTEASNQKVRYDENQRATCHQAFKTSAYESFKNLSPERVPGTCMWVLKHEKYKRWHQSSHDDLLWISADPGCGKSVLAKSLVENELRNTSKHTVCYFFFKDNAGQVSLATALCALLHQLFNSQPHLIKHAMGAFLNNGNALQHEVDEMWRILLAAVADEDAHSVTCILDALDECARNDQEKLIQLLTGFYSIRSARSTAKAHLKFLVTSRAYRNIEDGFNAIPPQLPSIRLAGEDRNSDISHEISLAIHRRVSEIANKHRLDQDVHDALLQKLQATPHRTYLWLYLATEEILHSNKRTKAAFMRTIDSLPETVEEAYEQILKKHDEKHREHAQILLRIVVIACRPLSLVEMDVAFALATDSRKAQNHKGLDLDKCGLEQRIRDLCGLFVFVNDKRIYLIHQTAKEFLVAKTPTSQSIGGRWKGSLDDRLSNEIMARICVQYLSFADVQKRMLGNLTSPWEWKEEVMYRQSDNSFLHYSAINWPVHVSNAHIDDEQLLVQIISVLYNDNEPRFGRLSSVVLKYDLYTPPFTEEIKWRSIHLAAFNGHTEILHRLLCNTQDVDVEGGGGATALELASLRGHNEIVERLLVKGADVNKQLPGRGHNALQAAISAGHERTVDLLLNKGADITRSNISDAIFYNRDIITKLLIDKGADVNAEATNGLTPLAEASAWGTYTIVQLLIEAGADINSQPGCLGNPLVSACSEGCQKTARLLISKGAKINPPNKANCSALEVAASLGHLHTVRMLLKEGADINFTNYAGSTPLCEAAVYGDVFSVLLKNGANIHAPSLNNSQKAEVLSALLKRPENWEYLTQSKAMVDLQYEKRRLPLHIASEKGDIKLAKFFLDLGASPHEPANDKQTPSHKAAQFGHTNILCLLHENGATLDIADKGVLSPIHVACNYGQLEVVRFLLDHGVNANITDNSRRTPLHAAVWAGHVDVVRLLLQRGASINNVDAVRCTPLHTAASAGHIDIVNILLESGADPSIRTLRANTPLEFAQQHGHKQVAEALLRHSEVLNKQDSEAYITVILGGDSDQLHGWGQRPASWMGTATSFLGGDSDQLDSEQLGNEQLDAKVTNSEGLNKHNSEADKTVILDGDSEQPDTKATHSEAINKQDSEADMTVMLGGDSEQPDTKVMYSLFCCLCS